MEMKKDSSFQKLPEAAFLAFTSPVSPLPAGFRPLALPGSEPHEHTTTETLLWCIHEILEKVHVKWKMEIINATLPGSAEDEEPYTSSL